jgi:hypothetical protein
MTTILIIILILALIGAFPAWPYNRAYGPAPMGIVWVILLVLLILILLGGVPVGHWGRL